MVGKTIKAVQVRVPNMVKSDGESFALDLVDQTIVAVRRRGKYLIFDLGQQVLISHLRMEGKYLLFEHEIPDHKHFHFFFRLNDDSTLVYQDVRKFGTFELLSQSQEVAYFSSRKIGPEPTAEDFKLQPFERAIQASKKLIKPLLLEQRLVAGLGNIYVDEVLWAAKVHPERRAETLKKAEMKRLHTEIIRILKLAIEKGGSTIRTYRNALGLDGTMQDYLQVYGLTGQPCSLCGSAIQKKQVGGRGSHFCPKCQKR